MKISLKLSDNEAGDLSFETGRLNGELCLLLFNTDIKKYMYVCDENDEMAIIFDSGTNIRKIIKACITLDACNVRVEYV